MLARILLAGCAVAVIVHASDPCDRTGLDVVLEEEMKNKKTLNMKETMPAAGPNTVLLVIDAQRGFTINNRDDDVGGFAQVCLVRGNKHHLATLNNIVAEIEEVKGAGGLIIATKDYHPLDHCSFIGQADCSNMAESANEYASKTKTNGSYEYETNRYKNLFPPHCIGTRDGKTHEGGVPSDWTSTGEPVDKVFKKHPLRDKPPVESGTDLHETVSDAMLGYARSFIAYKGFSRAFESFGAFPLKGEAANQDMVGGKLWLDTEGKHPRPYEKWINPTAEAFNTYMSKGAGFKALEAYLNEQSVNDVRVVGYVWDFCVKETAIGAVQSGFAKTSVLAYATRPAADGIRLEGVPGVPDSGRHSEPLLGSTAAARNAFSQLIANNVQVVMKPQSTSSFPGNFEL